jgi:predicted MPP superfamily phosphohydrolase
MLVLSYFLAFAMLAGQVAMWTWFYNRLHASEIPSRLVHRLEKWVILAMLVSTLVPAAWVLARRDQWLQLETRFSSMLILVWAGICWLMLAHVVVAWGRRQWVGRTIARLVSNDTQCLHAARLLEQHPIVAPTSRLLGKIPGNQILKIYAQHKTLHVANLPGDLDGLRLVHLSDLHMVGQFTPDFFALAVDHINQWQPDVVAVTGDLVDREDCIAWIPGTLGRLQSRFGVYAILGNHDQRLVDVARLRQALTDCGIEDIGGRCVVRRIRHTDVLLAGNEHPWFPRPAESVVCCPEQRFYRILLAHSPDQFPWARAHQFDLMLAGHTHGGQIRFPVVGPVVCPSRFGVRYASGIFDVPPTLMHVSRGLSGVHPLRFNCPPEITLLELRREEPRHAPPALV